MGKYGHRYVKTKSGCRFELLPCNSVDQFVLKSPEYSTFTNCKKNIEKLRVFIINEKVSSIKSPHVECDFDGDMLYSFRYVDEENRILPFKSRDYNQKRNVNKAIISIYRNIDEYVSYCKGTVELD